MGRERKQFRSGLGYRGVQVLAFVEMRIADEGRAPSYAEIRDELGMHSRAAVAHVVARLEARGLLKRTGKGRVSRIRLPSKPSTVERRVSR